MFLNEGLQFLRDWSEVLALLIPILVAFFYRPKGEHLQIIIWYVIIGFILNLAAMFMLEYADLVPSWMYVDNLANNNIFYNIHSIIRVLLFSWYIIAIREHRFTSILRILLAAYICFVLINFIIIESPFYLSTHLFAAESILLLLMCFSYFFNSIQDEGETNWLKHPSFLICSGISLYEFITFFIFLFFYALSQKDQAFFVVTMRIYGI